ncbi:hypothetical protein [Gordonia terrae]|nr:MULTISPECIES: hypothetical protein [Gordonia]
MRSASMVVAPPVARYLQNVRTPRVRNGQNVTPSAFLAQPTGLSGLLALTDLEGDALFGGVGDA